METVNLPTKLGQKLDLDLQPTQNTGKETQEKMVANTQMLKGEANVSKKIAHKEIAQGLWHVAGTSTKGGKQKLCMKNVRNSQIVRSK